MPNLLARSTNDRLQADGSFSTKRMQDFDLRVRVRRPGSENKTPTSETDAFKELKWAVVNATPHPECASQSTLFVLSHPQQPESSHPAVPPQNYKAHTKYYHCSPGQRIVARLPAIPGSTHKHRGRKLGCNEMRVKYKILYAFLL